MYILTIHIVMLLQGSTKDIYSSRKNSI